MNVYGYCFLGVVVVLTALFIYEKLSGKKVFPYILSAKPIMASAVMLAKAIAATTDSKWFDTVVIVMEAASDGTVQAEKLWLAGEIAKEERKAYATKYIEDTLKKAGIEITEQIESMIQGIISICCALLPHGLKPETRGDVSVE